MKRFWPLLIAGLLAASCGRVPSNLLQVDLDRALKHPAGMPEAYAQVEQIPLRLPEGVAAGDGAVLEVAADRFFVLDAERDRILVFDGTGDYLTTLACAEPVIDFSVYRDRLLDVLTAGGITTYSIADFAVRERHPIRDDEVALHAVARVDDDSITMCGTLDGQAYGCGYLVGLERFYSVHASAVAASDYERGRFFRCGDSTYYLCRRAGVIYGYTGDDYIHPAYGFDFGRRSPSLLRAQKADSRIYLALELDGEEFLLRYDLKDRHYRLFRRADGGAAFPLGVIYDGSNYCLRPASADADDPVVLKYSL